ncbi:MAG: NADH-quinone oxidoreductase subunit H [Myxococcaceae bacterium]|nr:NADH-quinone oxidoreductase subunit H [Myxococcaceae bacterium]MCI0673891.1 NADH-quinone oxidoreductase subunit H [Myxococcaceae bacterium]
MSRTVFILVSIFLVIPALLAGVMMGAYALGGWLDGVWFPGAHRLTNILVLMLVFVMVLASLLTLAERKWSALMQNRIGPNRADLFGRPVPAGIGHFIADALKMLTKEDFRPAKANTFLYNLGPLLAFAPVFALFAVVPAGPTLEVFGKTVDMVVATPDFGLLFIFAIASLAVYGTSLAGWSSNNKFALLGGVRAASQMISYEVALGLSLVGLMMAFSTVQLPAFVGEALGTGQFRYLWGNDAAMGLRPGFDVGLPAWGIFLQPVAFVLFFAAAFAETKRAPFDMPEGESEIIGYFVEYSGMKFGMFMLSEFMEIVILSGVMVVLFFGGYHLPIGEEWLRGTELMRSYPLLLGAVLGMVFWLKVLTLCYLQLVVRWTFPRFRYDQVQKLGWKMLLPVGLVNVFVTGALVLWDPSLRLLALSGLLVIAVVLALTMAAPGEAPAEAHGEGHGHAHGDTTALPPSHAHATGHAQVHALNAHTAVPQKLETPERTPVAASH